MNIGKPVACVGAGRVRVRAWPNLNAAAWRWLASLAFLAASASCATGPGPLLPPNAAMPVIAPRATRDSSAVPDAWIVQALASLLGSSPIVASETIGADSVNGVVTLRGQVSNRLARERAVAIAQVVRGVRAIIDRIDVIPDPRPDYELEFVAAHAVAADPVLAGQRVAVRVHSGIAFLSGFVDSAGSAHLAESDILALPGVAHVIDDLTVQPRAPSDDRVTLEAKRLLRDDPWLDSTHVDVAAQQGALIVSGWVGTGAERARAESDLRATSPRAIDVSRLRLDPWTESRSLRTHLPIVRTDAQLAQALTDAYVRDPRVPPFVPTIDAHGGLVVLTGIAPNPYASRAAARDARDLPGVVHVADDLKTLPDVASVGDRAVWLEVRAALDREPALASRPLIVHVLDGTVYLTGCVTSDTERVRVLGIAAGVAGALDVEDGMLVGLGGDANRCEDPRVR